MQLNIAGLRTSEYFSLTDGLFRIECLLGSSRVQKSGDFYTKKKRLFSENTKTRPDFFTCRQPRCRGNYTPVSLADQAGSMQGWSKSWFRNEKWKLSWLS